MRGNLELRPDQRLGIRSIPARAGEPLPAGLYAGGQPVYPRACGGTGPVPWEVRHQEGLSPRVRGNLAVILGTGGVVWSIPARAGEPLRRSRCSAVDRVYPRACGGTMDTAAVTPPMPGLSPRVRGNLEHQPEDGPYRRSIPARAGEPFGDGALRAAVRVYPRACGGTVCTNKEHYMEKGLSPRVRGNLIGERQRVGEYGSIPARAGEPSER